MRLTRNARDERGFTLMTTMLALFVLSLLALAAIAAANGDINLSRYDQDDKQAYAAAEAGINDYLAHLDQDSNYWTKCTGGAGNGINDQIVGTPNESTRKWRAVPGTTSSDYSIELIPRQTLRPGESAAPTACDTSDPVGSMIDGGNLTIRSTGRVKGRKKRSIVASFRRTGFLDFIYFTDLENQDPTYLDLTLFGKTETRSKATSADTEYKGLTYQQWAGDYCNRYRWDADGGRDTNPQWPQVAGSGQYKNSSGDWRPISDYYGIQSLGLSTACGEITFANNDIVDGPMHSNDDIQLCGSPTFGRDTGTDKVEIEGDEWHKSAGCSSASPNFRPRLTTNASHIGMPPTNASIQQAADPAYQFKGLTTIRLKGNDMEVTNALKNGGNTYTTSLPSNGVIYVKNITCSYGYNVDNTDLQDANCGAARISGNYNQDLTIATEDDIIVDGNVTRTSDTGAAVLGLVAKNFVRVWHPVDNPGASNCQNRAGTPRDIQIDAAILSLAHSFTVDNYSCGSSLGNLTVNGIIAQKHRGVVGTSGGTGYTKNYKYDDRLKYRAPPFFLDPTQSSWRILRQSEQSPAR